MGLYTQRIVYRGRNKRGHNVWRAREMRTVKHTQARRHDHVTRFPQIHASKFVIRAHKMQAWLGRIAANAVIAGILVAIVPMGLRGQSADEVEGLNKQIVQLYGQGRYAEAIATALQALALAERTLGASADAFQRKQSGGAVCFAGTLWRSRDALDARNRGQRAHARGGASRFGRRRQQSGGVIFRGT